MKKGIFSVSVLVAALTSATAMAAEPAADEFLAMSKLSGNVASMSENQLASIEGAGGYGSGCSSAAGQLGLLNLLNLNALNCNNIQILNNLTLLGISKNKTSSRF